MRYGALLIALVACGGKDDEGTAGCEEYVVEVTVDDGMGGAVPGVAVSIGQAPCTDTGDGKVFECVTDETGDVNVYAEATDWEAKGQQVTVTEPDDCSAAAASVTLSMIRESAV